MAHDHDLPFVERCFWTANEFLDVGCNDDDDHIYGSTPICRNNRKSQRQSKQMYFQKKKK